MNRSKLCIMLLSVWLWAPLIAHATGADSGYIAKKDDLRSFFDALSSRLNKPVIVSKLAARKQVSGEFDLNAPQQLLARISQQLGLIWYHDGQAIYIYDASETRNAVVSLSSGSLNTFNSFLRKSGLYDSRYPLRALDSNSVFYVAGPPVFVELVVKAASLLDRQSDNMGLGRQRIGVIRLNNTFVGDRSYEMRQQKVVIPGMASVIEQLLAGETASLQQIAGTEIPSDITQPYRPLSGPADSGSGESAASNIKVMAYPDTNSLLVKGTTEQVRFIERLVAELDIPKRHVELSLWIIDMNKEDLDQMGVDWRGSAINGSLGISLNQRGSLSTLDGDRFIASVMALAQEKRANVVSRPVVLTQENVPAIFDNNRTFYARLVGERNASLEQVTYGTLVSVLPRFSADDQIEMVLNIEDGNEVAKDDGKNDSDALPEVGRTRISTVARVPQGKSLLLGGYTRDASNQEHGKIPLLGDLPLVGGLFRYSTESQSNTARVFLIQPREINSPLRRNANDLVEEFLKEKGLADDQQQGKFRNALTLRHTTPVTMALSGYLPQGHGAAGFNRGN